MDRHLEVGGISGVPASRTTDHAVESRSEGLRKCVNGGFRSLVRGVARMRRDGISINPNTTQYTESHTISSSTNGKLKNPTSCPTPVFTSSGIKPLLAARLSASQSAVPSPLASDGQHRFFLVLSAYPVTGKKPEVHVSGGKYCQVPSVVEYSGYLTGLGRALNVARTFWGTREE